MVVGCEDSCQFYVFIINNLYHFIWDYWINNSSFIGTFIYQLTKRKILANENIEYI